MTEHGVAILRHDIVGWGLTVHSTQFRSCRAFKVELCCKYENLIGINYWK